MMLWTPLTSNLLADHFQDQPVVIVEVLSDSTRRADLYDRAELA